MLCSAATNNNNIMHVHTNMNRRYVETIAQYITIFGGEVSHSVLFDFPLYIFLGPLWHSG
jgi:hypothetical protein